MLIAGDVRAQSPYAQWKNGPSTNADYFPIGVWVQNPKNAERYKAAGINLFVGLWRGLGHAITSPEAFRLIIVAKLAEAESQSKNGSLVPVAGLVCRIVMDQ